MRKVLKILFLAFFLILVVSCSKNETTISEPIDEEVIIIPEITPLLTLKNKQVLAEFETNSEGTSLKIDELTLSIPAEAYGSKTSFKIVKKDIISNQLEFIEPVSSLYEIDNGNIFSDVPIGLQIHLNVDTDKFVMPFFFDEENETLEGIPSIRLNNGDLLVLTHHFSNVFVGMMNEEDLKRYQSGAAITTLFTPGIDDFSFKNYGSYLSPSGHCSGQSIAAMWYFKNIRLHNLNDPNSALHGLLDNNDLFSTPNFWRDDSLLYRFASSVHEDEKENNNSTFDKKYISNIITNNNTGLIPDYNAKDHWDAFYASMILTKRPQLVSICREEEGKRILCHALIAYMIEDNRLYVADPNHPGEIRFIEYDNGEFKTYFSGSNAQEIEFNQVYFLGEFATIDEWKIEKRWEEVINKNLENEYFPYPLIISDGITSYKQSYEFNIEISQLDLQNKIRFQVVDKNLQLIIPTLSNGYTFPDSSLSFPLIAVNETNLKTVISLNDEGDNWLGFQFTDKNNNWQSFQWVKIFVDTKLQLTADKYIINPGDTAHIVAAMPSGIDFPDLEWRLDRDLDAELGMDNDNDFIICSKSKSCDFTSKELGEYSIFVYDPLSSLRASISITVTDDTLEDQTPISENDSHIASGTYSCSFWLSSYEAIPFEKFKSGVFYTAEHKKQIAIDNAKNYNELYGEKISEVTYDREDFTITIHEDGTCDVSFSTFLFVNSNSSGISKVPFNGGNIRWTEEKDGAKFEGNITLNLTDNGVEMKGSIIKKNPENQFMFNESKTYSFEGEKKN